MIRAVATLSVLCLAVPALAQTPTPTDIAAKPKKPKRICRSDSDTGSHMVTSTCHTVEEWARIDASRQQDSQQLQQDIRNANRTP